MASAVATTVVRRVVASAKTSVPKLGNRQFHSSGTKQMADHGSSGGSIYSNDYIHAPHMYNILGMKNKRVKMGLLVFGSLTLGLSVPVYATHYQLAKSSPV